ncbi:MAG: hypothetical protein AB2A00_24305 [Myxococcota bacterium]
MLELYNFMESNHDGLVSNLLGKVPKEVPAYSRLPRNELKQSIEHLLEAYTDLLVTGQDEGLRAFFKYIAKVRSAQSFKLSDVMRALLCFPPVIRRMLQDEYRDKDGDGLAGFNKAMEKIESTCFQSACTFVDIFQEYLDSRIKEHNDYLNEKNKQLGVDLSKFILFRG